QPARLSLVTPRPRVPDHRADVLAEPHSHSEGPHHDSLDADQGPRPRPGAEPRHPGPRHEQADMGPRAGSAERDAREGGFAERAWAGGHGGDQYRRPGEGRAFPLPMGALPAPHPAALIARALFS